MDLSFDNFESYIDSIYYALPQYKIKIKTFCAKYTIYNIDWNNIVVDDVYFETGCAKYYCMDTKLIKKLPNNKIFEQQIIYIHHGLHPLGNNAVKDLYHIFKFLEFHDLLKYRSHKSGYKISFKFNGEIGYVYCVIKDSKYNFFVKLPHYTGTFNAVSI